MKNSVAISTLLASAILACAEVLNFDLSPPGISPAVGLSPSNELHVVVGSTGSGNEILGGITLETTNLVLELAIGYGSTAGFADLTGPVTGVHIHGPAPASGTANVIVDLANLHVPAGDPAKGGLVFGSVTLDAVTASNLLAGLTYINLHTATNPDGEVRGQLVLMLNSPPSVSPLTPLTLECTSPDGTPGTLTATVSDPDNDALSVVWSVDGAAFQTNLVAAGESAAGVELQFLATYGLGTHDVTVTATDDDNESATSGTTVTVVDTTPPVIDSIRATPNVLWPPNHRLTPVRINVEATDACGGLRARVVSIESNEEANGLGDGNTSPDSKFRRRSGSGDSSDWRVLSPLRVLLRAERSGTGSGRVYTVTVEVQDGVGNASTGTVEVSVPHDRGSGSVSSNNGKNLGKSKKPKKSKNN